MWLNVILGLVTCVGLWYWYMNRHGNYWESRGVPQYLMNENHPLGFLAVFMNLVKFHKVELAMYRKYPTERFVGMFEFSKPTVLIRDLDLLRHVMIKDFEHFTDKRELIFGPLGDAFLLNRKGHEWKSLRSATTPVFTATKLKRMFPHLEKSAKSLRTYIEGQKTKTGSPDVVLRDMFDRYVMDIIASSAFGFEARCLTSEDSDFMKAGEDLQNFRPWNMFKLFFALMFPWVFYRTGLEAMGTFAMPFFQNSIKAAIRIRKENKGKYQDFVASFVEQMEDQATKETTNESELSDFEKLAKFENTNTEYRMTERDIVATGVGFFFAGFDTTVNLLTLSAYHLTMDADIQQRMKDDIEQACESTDGKITYDSLAKMEYVDAFIHEILRIYPFASNTDRKVSKPYKIPDSDVVLPIGMMCHIPILAIHMDEKYYPNPKKFNPDNFSAENRAKRSPYAWLPFGIGPRSCIGMRFALVMAKAALANLVLKFELKPCGETWPKLKFEPMPGQAKVAKGLKIALNPRDVQHL